MHTNSIASRATLLTVTVLLASCAVQAPPPRVVYVTRPAAIAYVPQPPPPVVSVYIEPLLFQPAPVVIGWAPPPMLVEAPLPIPFEGAFWIGGYWAWHGNWVWSAGRWAQPPLLGYGWANPYYENRSGVVIFIAGHWAAPGVVFVPPPPTLNLTVSVALAGVVPGPHPIGPSGVFVPPPPGSRPGLIIPAPIGTSPAVVIGAPPVTNVGMRIQNQIENNTTINSSRVTNITNVTNVTIVAPASATSSGHAFEVQVPNQAHLAAAQTPAVHAIAPKPVSNRPIAAFASDRPLTPLPPAQAVHMHAPAALAASATAFRPTPRAESTAMHPPAASPPTSAAAQAEHPTAAPEQQREAQIDRLTAAAPEAASPAKSASTPAPHAQHAQADTAALQATKKQQAEVHHAEIARAKTAIERAPKNGEHEREHKSE